MLAVPSGQPPERPARPRPDAGFERRDAELERSDLRVETHEIDVTHSCALDSVRLVSRIDFSTSSARAAVAAPRIARLCGTTFLEA